MAVNYNPSIVTNGLVCCVDAADLSSYSSGSATWNDMTGDANFVFQNDTATKNIAHFTDDKGLLMDGSDDFLIGAGIRDIAPINTGGTNGNFTFDVWFKKNASGGVGIMGSTALTDGDIHAANGFNVHLTVDGSNNSVVSKVMALELSGLYAKEFVSAPTFTIDAPTRKNASGVLDGTTAAGTISLNASNKIASVAISNNGDGYLVDSPTIRFTTGAQNELRTEQNRKHIKHIELNHVDVDQIVTAVNTQTSNAAISNVMTKNETTGEIEHLLSSGNPVTSTKIPAPHDVKVINNSYGVNIENGYQERKGSFFNTPRLYNSGQTIEFLGTNTIESIDTTVINKYNTRTNVKIA